MEKALYVGTVVLLVGNAAFMSRNIILGNAGWAASQGILVGVLGMNLLYALAGR